MTTLPSVRRRPLSLVAFDVARSIARAAAARALATLDALATRWLDPAEPLPERDWLDVPFRVDPRPHPRPEVGGTTAEITPTPAVTPPQAAAPPTATEREPLGWLLGRRIADEIERRLGMIATLSDDVADPVATVHRARVATRRLRSLLELLGEEIPRAGASKKTLRRIGRALGDLRELDAQAELLAARSANAQPLERAAVEHVLEGIARRRSTAARRARDRCAEFDLEALTRNLRAVADALVGRLVREPNAGRLAADLLERRVAGSWPARDGQVPLELAQLHALRIAAKRIRHACDLLGPALPDDTLHDAARAVQRTLGHHRDASLLLATLERRQAKLARRRLPTLQAALLPEIDRLRARVASLHARSSTVLVELDRAVATVRTAR